MPTVTGLSRQLQCESAFFFPLPPARPPSTHPIHPGAIGAGKCRNRLIAKASRPKIPACRISICEGVLKRTRIWSDAGGLGRLNGDHTHATRISKIIIETRDVTFHIRHDSGTAKHRQSLRAPRSPRSLRSLESLEGHAGQPGTVTLQTHGRAALVCKHLLPVLISQSRAPAVCFASLINHAIPCFEQLLFSLASTAIIQPYFDYNCQSPAQTRMHTIQR